jgi:ABC-2 type transport system permease protein
VEVLDAAEESVGVRMVALTDEGGEAEDTTWLYAGLGYAMGFIIYIAMFVYGAMVMRGVIEEKTNRIVEIVASSARPFQLMMGKVLGIGAVGLTQFVLWVVLALVGMVALGSVLAGMIDPAALAGADAAGMSDLPIDPSMLTLANVPLDLVVYFLLFFLGGYLLYGSLFAAVGSAVEQESDAQSLQLPIMIPVILPAVFLPFIADNPDAPISVALSLVPFFSPILMVVRAAATDVPFWQMASALVLLTLGFLGTIWVASRIYRVGILMYGKKATFRDLARWVRTA